MRKNAFVFSIMLLLLAASCAKGPKTVPEEISLSRTDFSDLPGWDKDHFLEAVPALARSCAVLARKPGNTMLGVAGTVDDWAPVCADLSVLPPRNDEASRAFFEHWFRPYAVAGPDGNEGLFTGYYEAELHGAAKQGKTFQTPLYPRPDDLINVDLGDFKQDLKGQKIIGKVDGHALKPYDERAQIARGSLDHRAQALLWVDDPVDAFFLEIQGSGRVRMGDGSVMRVGYEGSNGRAYVAIGRAMADKNLIEKPVTMQSIRSWLKAHPDQAEEIMDLNPSYVFFRKLDGEKGPVGAEGVELTPGRSMAVDPNFIPYGVPLWLDTQDAKGNTLQRVVVAQDTGGAIKGVVRGDFFWGFGDEATEQAGAMQSRGHYYLLIPKSANVKTDD